MGLGWIGLGRAWLNCIAWDCVGLTCIELGRSEGHWIDLDYGKDWIRFSCLRWTGTSLVVICVVLLWIDLEYALTRAELDGIGLSWIELD